MVTIRSLKLECPIVAHCNVQNEHILPLWSHSVALGFDTCVCTRIKHPVRLLSYLLCFGWMVGCSTESKLLLLTLFVLCRVSMYMHGQGYAIRNILGNYQTFVQIYNSIFYYILLYIYTHVLHMFYHSVLYCSTLKSKYVTTQYLLVQLFHHFYLAAFLLLLLLLLATLQDVVGLCTKQLKRVVVRSQYGVTGEVSEIKTRFCILLCLQVKFHTWTQISYSITE